MRVEYYMNICFSVVWKDRYKDEAQEEISWS